MEREVSQASLELFMQALYYLGLPDATIEQLDGDGDSHAGGGEEGDHITTLQQAALATLLVRAKLMDTASSSSGQGATAVFLDTEDCAKTWRVFLDRLQALDGFDATAANAIRCCLLKRCATVQRAAAVAYAVAKQHRAVGLRQAPNVPHGTCSAVAVLTFRHSILAKAMQQLAGKQQTGNTATEAQLTGINMLQLLAPALPVLEAVKLQLDTHAAAWSMCSRPLAGTCAGTRQRRVELQVALLCLGVEANRAAGGECSVCLTASSLPIGQLLRPCN